MPTHDLTPCGVFRGYVWLEYADGNVSDRKEISLEAYDIGEYRQYWMWVTLNWRTLGIVPVARIWVNCPDQWWEASTTFPSCYSLAPEFALTWVESPVVTILRASLLAVGRRH